MFEDGEAEIGGWIIEHMTHYNQVFINLTRELLLWVRQELLHMGTLTTEYAFHQVRSELFPREPSQGFASIDRSSRHYSVLTLQSAGSEKNQLQMPGLHPAAARIWERVQ